MFNRINIRSLVSLLVSIFVFLSFSSYASAHCDSLEGPVVEDARKALNAGDVTVVLKWVNKDQESIIRDAFEQTIIVRTKGDIAKALADRYFFETLVRIHRAGEGEDFNGLKSAIEIDSGLEAADRALEYGSITELADHLSTAVSEGIHSRYKLVRERQTKAKDSVILGREYVKAYVDYIHYVENIHRIITRGSSHLHKESLSLQSR